MADALRKYSADWATLQSFWPQRALAGQAQYIVQLFGISRGSSQRQMDVIVPAIAYSRCYLADVSANLGCQRCKGPPAWKGEANMT
jgi:hypothetical protein